MQKQSSELVIALKMMNDETPRPENAQVYAQIAAAAALEQIAAALEQIMNVLVANREDEHSSPIFDE
jgi:hypothetical protein